MSVVTSSNSELSQPFQLPDGSTEKSECEGFNPDDEPDGSAPELNAASVP